MFVLDARRDSTGLAIAVVCTTAVTAALGWILFVNGVNTPMFVPTLVAFPFAYVALGRLLAGIVESLFDATDNLFNGNWGSWTKGSKMVWASLWPVTFFPCFIVALVALVFGTFFRKLF